jgi:glycosyltransferase involved in cell wall biosynthesis
MALLERVPDTTRVLRTPWWDVIPAVKRACRPAFLARRRRVADQRTAPEPPAQLQASLASAADFPSESPARSFKDWLTRLLITPDSRIGWLTPAVARGLREIRRRRPRVIYSTSPCMTAHLIALVLHKLTRVPWVADFRDPWRDNPFRDLRYPSLNLIDARLERVVLRAADHVVCTTPTLRDLLARRIPEVASKCSTISNGFDACRFADGVAKRTFPADHVVLTHCGDFYGPRRPDAWLAAIAKILASEPRLRDKFHLLLIGGEWHDERSLKSLAHASGLADCVAVLGRRDHREAIALMKGSDALLLAGQGGPGGSLQVPNKLYEYLALKRPIIAAVHPDNPAIEVLRDAHAEAIITAPDDADALANAIRQVATRQPIDVAQPWSGVAHFERARRAEQLAEVFEAVSSMRPEPQASARVITSTSVEPPAVEPIEVSVIVPVSREIRGLSRTLRALKAQSRPPGEVIVAPQDNAPETLAALRECLRLYPFARIVTGKRCNVADARNRAIRVAGHEVIACTEAGCVPERTWLERITAPLANRRTEVVGGMCEARGRNLFERLAGLMIAPSGDRPRDPLRFNPGAKSMAFRASTWRRAGGFPNWLDGDDDTLFAMKLRSTNPPVGFAVAVDAVATYKPARTLRTLFRTRFAKASGEAQTGRGTRARRLESLRYAGVLLIWSAAIVCGAYVGPASAGMCAAASLIALAWPHHRGALRAARRMKSIWYYLPAVVVGAWGALAEWLGRWRGYRDRRSQPDLFVDRLHEYLGSDSADLVLHPWSLVAAPVPRTLVVSWHWPPTADHGANLLADVLRSGPTSGFRVLTRHTPERSQPAGTPPPVETHYVDWPLRGDCGNGIWQRLEQWRTLRAMIRRADAIAERDPLDRVMCAATDPAAQLAAWIIARRLDVPFVPVRYASSADPAIMRTGLAGRIRLMIERITLKSAWMVIAESETLADQCRRNGIERVWTLPSTPDSAGYDHRLTELLRRLITGTESRTAGAPPASNTKPNPPGQPPHRPSSKSPPMPEHV